MNDYNEKHERLLKLHQSRNGLTPASVVKDATNPKSPLHSSFTWDDETAAHEHRLDQARDLIRSFRVTVVTPATEKISVRAFVHEPERQSYAPVEEVISDDLRRAAEMARIQGQLKAWADKARAFKEFADVVRAVDEMDMAA